MNFLCSMKLIEEQICCSLCGGLTGHTFDDNNILKNIWSKSANCFGTYVSYFAYVNDVYGHLVW